MTELIQRTVGPSILVETVSAPDLWPASVDASQLENAILNLCINSRDAMPDGGRIIIETANQWLDAEAALANDLPAGEYLSLTVTDTGTGMAPGVIAWAFDPFTTKPIGEGTGLGLSMIYGSPSSPADRCVSVRNSAKARRCVFIYRAITARRVPALRPRRSHAALTGSCGTILIVDDEPTVRLLLTDVLGDLGYTLIEAADSLTGLKLLQSDVDIDLLITDVGLPGA